MDEKDQRAQLLFVVLSRAEAKQRRTKKESSSTPLLLLSQLPSSPLLPLLFPWTLLVDYDLLDPSELLVSSFSLLKRSGRKEKPS